MIKKIVILLFICSLSFSCRSLSDVMKADSNIRKVELGMTKKEIVSIMGKSYQAVGAIQTPEGDIEVLGYQNTEEDLYKLHILNGKLVRWELEKSRPHRHNHN